MLYDIDSIFDIVHSLPVVTHSVGIATRRPTSVYSQQSKFMPDYGGFLEIPNSALKNNALANGLPFQPKSSFNRISRNESSESDVSANLIPTDCLAAIPHSKLSNEFFSIRAFGSDLYFDHIKETLNNHSDHESDYESTQYAHVSYPNKISGIKHSKSLQEFLLVKFEQGIKTIKLDKLSQLNEDGEKCPSGPSAIKSVASISERQGFYVRDACLNSFNKSIQGIASDNLESCQVKLYDVTSSRQSFHTVYWKSRDSASLTEESIERHLRGRIVRKFIPMEPAERGIQQLDNIPSHLVNMLATTDCQTVLIDPRLDRLGQVYVDKSEVPSFYPIEFLRKTEFSQRNSYQFYSLSNVHIRVFDTRYPGMPVNQLNHMLDSATYDSMNLKVITHDRSNLEILCASSFGRLCFMTFDQSQTGKLINPKSLHLPYHELNLNEIDPDSNLGNNFGLEVKTSRASYLNDEFFSVLQLSSNGDILSRKFMPPQDDTYMDIEFESRAKVIVHQDKIRNVERAIRERQLNNADIVERDILESEMVSDETEYIDILDSYASTDFEDRLDSKRALERFKKMKNKLDRT